VLDVDVCFIFLYKIRICKECIWKFLILSSLSWSLFQCLRYQNPFYFLLTFSPLHSAYSNPGQWFLEDGQTRGSALYQMHAYSQRTAVPPVTAYQFPVPHLQKTFASPVHPLEQLSVSKYCDQVT
jgi:hypothetical protein